MLTIHHAEINNRKFDNMPMIVMLPTVYLNVWKHSSTPEIRKHHAVTGFMEIPIPKAVIIGVMWYFQASKIITASEEMITDKMRIVFISV